MTDCEYWKDVIAKMTIASDANWAAHVLASHSENLAQARNCLTDSEIIEAVISAYADGDWLTQSYCDELLSQFDKGSVQQVYGRMHIGNEIVQQAIKRFLTL